MAASRSFAAILTLLAALTITSCSKPTPHPNTTDATQARIHFPAEKHLANLRQLTRGGTNAEAYWSFDGQWLAFQHKGPGFGLTAETPHCDQIYFMKADGSEVHPISKNIARTTCSYFLPDDERILFSSTMSSGKECPPEPDMSKGYVWPIYNSYQMYSAKRNGEDVRPMEPGAPRAYNAEATVCRDGSVIFTSDRDGDLDLYTGKLDSFGTMTNVRRVTHGMGYDGGAFFSQDCKKIVWRASRPRAGKELDDYKALLKQHLVRPGALEIWVANADGSQARQITRMGAASFAPYFTPDNKRVLFASNPRDPRGRSFDIYMINVDGTGLERITYSNTFESFPMFSPDGTKLAFSSNRNATAPRETNVFVADWVETPISALSMDDADPANRFMALTQKLMPLPPQDQAEAIAERFASLGVKPIGNELQMPGLGVIGTIGASGQKCGKSSPVLISAQLGNNLTVSGAAGLVETLRFVKEAPGSDRQCTIFAALTGTQLQEGLTAALGSLKKAGIRPKAIFHLDSIGGMENNQLLVAGLEPALETRVSAACADKQLICAGPQAADSNYVRIAGTPSLTFRTLGEARFINATGAIQAAELVTAMAVQTPKGKPPRIKKANNSIAFLEQIAYE